MAHGFLIGCIISLGQRRSRSIFWMYRAYVMVRCRHFEGAFRVIRRLMHFFIGYRKVVEAFIETNMDKLLVKDIMLHSRGNDKTSTHPTLDTTKSTSYVIAILTFGCKASASDFTSVFSPCNADHGSRHVEPQQDLRTYKRASRRSVKRIMVALDCCSGVSKRLLVSNGSTFRSYSSCSPVHQTAYFTI